MNSDVIIIGGGLAGLGLALQLAKTIDQISVSVIEKNQFPVPETTAKVGESTVEIAAHYFTHTLGLAEHFKEKHLRKHGLRCFFGKPTEDYADQDELGVSELFGIPTYQIERGVLENHLHRLCTDLGVKIIDGANIHKVDLGDKQQQVSIEAAGKSHTLNSRWVIDAAGRQALIKSKMDLKKSSPHKSNAIFFRVGKKIVIDEWTDNQGWQQRLKQPGTRWLSTNHLMGPGYWVWVIPLGSGATSIGIVLDDQALDDSGIENYEDTLVWLQQEQPRCARELADAELLDFHLLKDYSYGCKNMFSDKGWALTGEAAAFTDPLYSPGSDFIAINNTFITHLIAKDLVNQDIKLDSAVLRTFYNSFFQNTLSLYEGQYGGFGDRRMMSIKFVWDYAYYWGVLTLLFYTDTITNIDRMREINPLLMQAQKLNEKMQGLLNKRAQQRLVLPTKGLFMNQYKIPCLKEFNEKLKQMDAHKLESDLKSNIGIMETLVTAFEEMLSDTPSQDISSEESAVLGDYRYSVLA